MTATPEPTPTVDSAPELPRFQPPASSSNRVEWAYRLLLLVLLCLIFVPFMGSFGLWDPWETHYGEVGRQMLERGDWVSPWWGSHWRDGNGESEGQFFFSKPVLLLWMMGIGMQLFGFSEWGVRLGTGLVTIFAVFMIYVMGREIWNRRAGMIMALVTATSPFFTMLGRQAQTDMPYVGLMTVGMCFFMMAVFGRRRQDKASRFDVGLLAVFWLLIFVPQMQLLWVKFSAYRTELPIVPRLARYGPVLVGIFSLVTVAVLVHFVFYSKEKTKRQIWIFWFYLFVALATLAKGVLGFALPGAVILIYLLVSREWRMLKQVELVRGILLFCTVCIPWYSAMFLRHGLDYWRRFFVHDHLRRLSGGVHQIDNGSFEHFIKWLGYGLFPWGSFVPAALARVTVSNKAKARTDSERARLLLVLWFIVSYSLFTLASTKFHHYVFPAVPALAMLVGVFLDDLLRNKVKSFWLFYLTAIALFVMVGYDLFSEPQNLKNLFTYQYDRMWHTSLTGPFVTVMTIIFAVGLLGLVLLAIRTRFVRAIALSVMMVASSGLAVWSLDVYMPVMAIDWSQGYLWDTYYDLCTPIESPDGAHEFKRYCAEPVIAYKLNWRGETFYTQNEVIPIDDDADFTYFIRQNAGRSFYAIMQHGRKSAFRSALPAELRSGYEEVHTENLKFVLMRVLNAEDRARREPSQEPDDDDVTSTPDPEDVEG